MPDPQAIPTIPPADDAKPKSPPKDRKSEPKDEPLGPKGPGTTQTATGKPGKFHRELAEFLSVPAIAFELRGDVFCAYVWTIRSEPFAYAMADLADKNPALKRWLTRLIEGGVYGQVIWTGCALIVPILAYYHIYPQSMLNPFALSEQELGQYQAMMAGREARGNGRYSEEDSIPRPVAPQTQ